jgi:Ca2+/H+ antiporter
MSMIREFISPPVLWRLGVVLVWSLLMLGMAKFFSRNVTEIKKKPDFFTGPISTSLAVVGLLVPLVVGTSAFVVTSHPEQSVSFLLSASVALLLVLASCLWFELLVDQPVQHRGRSQAKHSEGSPHSLRSRFGLR